MKRFYLLIPLICLVALPSYGRAVYHFESSVVSDSQFGPDAVVEFELSDDGTWIETYATAAKSVTVAFEKSLDRGISAIELRKKNNRIRFEPNDGKAVSVTKLPPLFIGQVLFANENRRGRKINDYGSRIERDDIVYLAWKIVYRTLTPDIPVTLDIRITDAQGVLMRDAQSPADCTCRAVFRTGSERAAETEQYLGRLKARFGKGCRMEIVCGDFHPRSGTRQIEVCADHGCCRQGVGAPVAARIVGTAAGRENERALSEKLHGANIGRFQRQHHRLENY